MVNNNINNNSSSDKQMVYIKSLENKIKSLEARNAELELMIKIKDELEKENNGVEEKYELLDNLIKNFGALNRVMKDNLDTSRDVVKSIESTAFEIQDIRKSIQDKIDENMKQIFTIDTSEAQRHKDFREKLEKILEEQSKETE